ncbi:MAG: hypothetical protein IPK26_02120 [Planctomycetes bacterium]|nr:hypothetical protein [Planctomycetota bacterium]
MTEHDFEVRSDERAAAARRQQQAAARQRQGLAARQLQQQPGFLQRLDAQRPPAAPRAGGVPAWLARPKSDPIEAELMRLREGCSRWLSDRAEGDGSDAVAGGAAHEPAAVRTVVSVPSIEAAVVAAPMASDAGAEGTEAMLPPLGNEQIERVEATLDLAARLGQPELLLTIQRGPLANAQVRVVVLAPGCIGLRLSGSNRLRRSLRRGIDALVRQLETSGLEVRDVGWVAGSVATPPGPGSL